MMGQNWEGLALDKDLIVRGNRVYSKETCVFITPQLNNLLNHNAAIRGKYPQGVSWNKRAKKYQAHIRIEGKKIHLGYHTTIAEAERAYKVAKSAEILRQVNLPTTPDVVKENLIAIAKELLL